MSRAIKCTLVALAVAFVLVALFSVSGVSLAQKRTPRRRPSSTRQAASVNYSKFSHATRKHQQTCNTCHKVPTDNWKTVRDFPDVADFPGHDACIGCHRAQFFKGARPAICSICHSKVSPRDDARFAFRNPVAPRQFLIEFPHDKHQDVIAKLKSLPPKSVQFIEASFERALDVKPTAGLRSSSQGKLVAVAASQTASLRYAFHHNDSFGTTLQTSVKTYNNCAICHLTRAIVPKAPRAGWTDGYVPDDVTFKSVPTTHASCFNCHWKLEEPVASNCAGCHKLAPAKDEDTNSIKRISMKFRHEGGGPDKNHILECTACHINITRATTLRGLKPDVPITACSECHNKAPSHVEIANELEAIDKKPDFVCSYCHTSIIGSLDPPASHYLIAERPPRKRTDPK